MSKWDDPEYRRMMNRKYNAAYRERHRERINRRCRDYKRAHRNDPGVKETQRRWDERNRDKKARHSREWAKRNPAKVAQMRREHRARLGDAYVRGVLTNNSPLTADMIPQELVEIQRELMKLKRLRRQHGKTAKHIRASR